MTWLQANNARFMASATGLVEVPEHHVESHEKYTYV